MEFRHLRYFLALAEELHFGRAAQRLAITQPPLSLNIQQLEESIGARLFDRDSRGVRLTPAGEAFRGQAQALLRQAEQAAQLARDIEGGSRGRIAIGFVGTLLFCGLPRWLKAFQAAYPLVEVTLLERNSQEQAEALRRREIDVGFIHAPRAPDNLRTRLVVSQPFVCCVPQSHPLADRERIALAELREEPFVLFARSASPHYYAHIMDQCGIQGFQPKIRYEVRPWLSVVALVSQGLGVSIVPAAFESAGIHSVAFRPLADLALTSDIHCALPQDGALATAERFVRMIEDPKPVQARIDPA